MKFSRFPKDCWNKKCEHFHVWDMSIDDLCCACDVLNMECDACDEDFSYVICPMLHDMEDKDEDFFTKGHLHLGYVEGEE